MMVRTPVIWKVVDPARQLMVRLPFTARTASLPLSFGISARLVATIFPEGEMLTFTGATEDDELLSVLTLVVVLFRILERNSSKPDWFTKLSIIRLTGVPVVPTTAAETRTGNDTKS